MKKVKYNQHMDELHFYSFDNNSQCLKDIVIKHATTYFPKHTLTTNDFVKGFMKFNWGGYIYLELKTEEKKFVYDSIHGRSIQYLKFK